MALLPHELVRIVRGERSGLTLIVAVHSTALGRAVGGCRLWQYADWRDAVNDALRLSEAMSLKCALAGLPHGGGKAVIALTEGRKLTPEERRDAFLDLGDLVESLGGRYGTAEDVGTTAEDMLVARERTEFAYCLPESQGGMGEPSEPTAVGVMSAIRAVGQRLFSSDLVDRRIGIIGLGQVGSRLARRLHAAGASLVVTDIDETKGTLADELGARWVEPETALGMDVEILVPAALGGMFTQSSIESLRCSAIVGPANNQLADDSVASLLEERGILWAPDFVVNAGGAIYGSIVEVGSGDAADAMGRVEAIGETLATILETADRERVTPLEAAARLAHERISSASNRPVQEPV